MENINHNINDIDKYIAQFTVEIQKILNKFRNIIRNTATEAVEGIAYKMPAYKLNGKPLIYFAAHKNHIGFYPMPSAIDAFKNELSEYKQTGKGTLQIPYNKPIPNNLIKKIIEYRIKELSNAL